MSMLKKIKINPTGWLLQLESSEKAFWRGDIYWKDKNDNYVLGATDLKNQEGLFLCALALTHPPFWIPVYLECEFVIS